VHSHYAVLLEEPPAAATLPPRSTATEPTADMTRYAYSSQPACQLRRRSLQATGCPAVRRQSTRPAWQLQRQTGHRTWIATRTAGSPHASTRTVASPPTGPAPAAASAVLTPVGLTPVAPPIRALQATGPSSSGCPSGCPVGSSYPPCLPLSHPNPGCACLRFLPAALCTCPSPPSTPHYHPQQPSSQLPSACATQAPSRHR
jgi:hypothetical protein